MSGLRFCMVTTFYPPYNFGGDGMGVQRFSRALVRRGHRVTVLQDADAYRVLAPEMPRSGDADDGVEVVRLGARSAPLSVLLTQQVGRPVLSRAAIRRFFAEREFDVIVFNNVSLTGGPGILSYGDAVKVYMAHEHWLVCPTHVLWRHGREVCDRRECLRCALHYRRPPQLWRYTGLLRRQLRHVDAFIAMSEFSRDKHAEFGFPRPMEVVNYFLPDLAQSERTDGDDPDDEASPHPRPYFLFVGRLEKIKGLDDVIPVFSRYRDADLLVAGDGEYAGTLKEQARGIDSVRFLGRLAPDRLDRYYRHALALIVPSVCFETFGIILIESFRQGTPVLARAIGPFPEIVRRSEGGLLFREPRELEQALARMQQDPQMRRRMADSARRAFEAHWSETAVLPRFLDVVREAARRRGRREVLARLDRAEGTA